jgi:hypothetical protein
MGPENIYDYDPAWHDAYEYAALKRTLSANYGRTLAYTRPKTDLIRLALAGVGHRPGEAGIQLAFPGRGRRSPASVTRRGSSTSGVFVLDGARSGVVCRSSCRRLGGDSGAARPGQAAADAGDCRLGRVARRRVRDRRACGFWIADRGKLRAAGDPVTVDRVSHDTADGHLGRYLIADLRRAPLLGYLRLAQSRPETDRPRRDRCDRQPAHPLSLAGRDTQDTQTICTRLSRMDDLVHGGCGVHRRPFSPKSIDESLDPDRAVRVQEQRREQRSLPCAAQRKRTTICAWAQDRELHSSGSILAPD